MIEDLKNTTLNTNEIFGPTIQGEGIFTGHPSIFVRTVGCNLRCAFKDSLSGKVTLCDTPYTSHNPEKPRYKTVGEAMDVIKSIKDKHPNVKHIVITGGEPMLQASGVADLIQCISLSYNDMKITIETNGTIGVNDFPWEMVDLVSISPKLSSSACFVDSDVPKGLQDQHNRMRINISVIQDYISHTDSQLKFVYAKKGDETEIKNIVDAVKKDKKSFIFNQEVLIMPQGISSNALDASIKEGILEFCYDNNYTFCDRLHVRIWGDKRGV